MKDAASITGAILSTVNARFFVPDAHASGDVVPLPDEEAQHLTRVLRLGAGAAVRVFNGRGAEFEAVVDAVARRAVSVRVGTAVTAAPEPGVAVTLVQAVLKSDKMDAVVRDAVMMGAAAIQPVVAARSEVSLAAIARGRRRERWQRIAVASAKQCGRAVVPVIRDACEVGDVPAAISRLALPAPALMFVEPAAAADTIAIADVDGPAPNEVTVMIGPEGGWTPAEIEAAAPACRLVSLGGRTLRADAMAVVAMTALFTRWNAF
jgi:16S rRNA (uracil1498-N3)-methyltransferase